MINIYENNFNKIKRDLESSCNCTVNPVRDILLENRLCLEIKISTPIKDYYCYIYDEENQILASINALTSSHVDRLDLLDHIYLLKSYKLNPLDENSEPKITRFNISILKEAISESNNSFLNKKSDNINKIYKKDLDLFKKYTIKLNESHITVSKNEPSINYYINENFAIIRRTLPNKKTNFKRTHYFALDIQNNKHFSYNEKLETLIETLLKYNKIQKEVKYINSNITNHPVINKTKVKHPIKKATINDFNEAIQDFIQIKEVNFNTLNLENIDEIFKTKELEIELKNIQLNKIKEIYEEIKINIDDKIKILCDDNIKKIHVIFQNEINNLQKLGLINLRLKQEDINNRLNDKIQNIYLKVN